MRTRLKYKIGQKVNQFDICLMGIFDYIRLFGYFPFCGPEVLSVIFVGNCSFSASGDEMAHLISSTAS